MQIHTDIEHLPSFRNAVITIGSFDGVHQGHLSLFRSMQQLASAVGGTTIVISFHPHPRMLLSSDPFSIKLLSTQEEKIDLLEHSGIDHLVVVPFSVAFAEMPAEEYITSFLYRLFKPHSIVVGYDHKFGRNRTGDYKLLELYGKQLGFEVVEIPEFLTREIGISSTRIRKHLMAGEIVQANELLGYVYHFSGKVIRGNQLGRTIGFPTANLDINDPYKLLPANGVYAVAVKIQGLRGFHSGMMNIGNKPTVGNFPTTPEVHLFDFNEDLYDHNLTVYFKARIRNEIRFSGIESLKEQLKKDRISALELLSGE